MSRLGVLPGMKSIERRMLFLPSHYRGLDARADDAVEFPVPGPISTYASLDSSVPADAFLTIIAILRSLRFDVYQYFTHVYYINLVLLYNTNVTISIADAGSGEFCFFA